SSWRPALAGLLLFGLAQSAAAEMVGHGAIVNSVAVSPDGTQVLSGSWDYTVRLWDLATQKEIRTLNEHRASVNSVVFMPDGKQALSASWDATIKLWNLADGTVVRSFTGHPNNVASVAVTRDGRLAASAG